TFADGGFPCVRSRPSVRLERPHEFANRPGTPRLVSVLLNCSSAKSFGAETIFGARHSCRFDFCCSCDAQIDSSTCAFPGVLRTEVRAPFYSDCAGLGTSTTIPAAPPLGMARGARGIGISKKWFP